MTKNISKSIIYIMATMVVIAMVFGVTNTVVTKAAPEPSIIGIVDSQNIQDTYPAFTTAVNNILKEKERLEKELATKISGLDTAAATRLQESYNNQYNTYAQNQLTPVQTRFQDAIVASAREKGVNIVIDTQVVYFGGTDLTSAVKTKLGIK